MIRQPITLVGDGIENPWNARTMIDAAGMFGSACLFRDRAGLIDSWGKTIPDAIDLPLTTHAELARDYAPIIAFDNLDGAAGVYGFRLGTGQRPAIVVGNERRGLARDLQAIAHHSVQIPLASRTLNCVNVAAASAVALYYLSRGGGAPVHRGVYPEKRRPELALIGAADHVELGSSIRSSGAFGWDHVFVEDRAGVWFGCDRVTRSVGRAAARRGRNPIHVVPVVESQRFAFDNVCLITTRRIGAPLHRANLARGPRQLIAIPDEGCIDVAKEDWSRLGKRVTCVHLDLPTGDFVYHYRLIATIVLAEVARQVGQRAQAGIVPSKRRAPIYDSTLDMLAQESGATVFLEDLEDY